MLDVSMHQAVPEFLLDLVLILRTHVFSEHKMCSQSIFRTADAPDVQVVDTLYAFRVQKLLLYFSKLYPCRYSVKRKPEAVLKDAPGTGTDNQGYEAA